MIVIQYKIKYSKQVKGMWLLLNESIKEDFMEKMLDIGGMKGIPREGDRWTEI